MSNNNLETDDLRTTTDIAAPPEKVWQIISDLPSMGKRSPQCRYMKVFGQGVGAFTFNINRRGILFWPTTAKVLTWDPGKELAFRINENKAIWSYELSPLDDGAGTQLTEQRLTPEGTSALSRFMVKFFLGGEESFIRELEVGMIKTIAEIKAQAES